MKRYLKHLVIILGSLGYLFWVEHPDVVAYGSLVCGGIAMLLEWVMVQLERKRARQVEAIRRAAQAE